MTLLDNIKVLLTGASGTIGKEVFNELLKRSEEYEVSLFLRGSKKNKKNFQNHNNSKIFWGSLNNCVELERALQNQDIVIHLAGVLPDIAKEDPDLARETNIEGTQNLIHAMLKQNSKPKLIYSSSVTVYGDRLENPIIKITDPIDMDSDDVYTQTKIASEKLIKESGLKYSIFRLSYCVSTDIIGIRPLMFHMPLNTSIEVLHTKDVAT
ncbi:MAG: NAD(P)-dependent oxidoreductase, partial [Promethearchaeota archaeon]